MAPHSLVGETASIHASKATSTDNAKAAVVKKIAQDANNKTLAVAGAESAGASKTDIRAEVRTGAEATASSAARNGGLIFSAARFALGTAKGTYFLAAGITVTAVELYIGAGAMMFDAAANVVGAGVDTVKRVRKRGHEVTTAVTRQVKSAVHSVQGRGHEVISHAGETTVNVAFDAGFVGVQGLNKGLVVAESVAHRAVATASSVANRIQEVGGQAVLASIKSGQRAVHKGAELDSL